MSLDEELRAVLREEAETRLPPRPDLTSMIRGGRARRRRRTATRVAVGVLAVALIGGGGYGAAQIARGASEVTGEPTLSPSAGSTPYVDLDEAPLAPGTYRMFVGIDASGARIEADLTVDGPGWLGSEHPVVKAGPVGEEKFAGVSVYRPKSLAGGSGCLSDVAEYDVSTTMDGLARQLTKLPRSTVLQPPTPTTAHGHDAVHLRVRIDTACPIDYEGDGYRLAQSSSGVRGLNWQSRLMLVDFWVLDVDGTPVVVDMFHAADAPWALVEQASRARESIRFVTDDG